MLEKFAIKTKSALPVDIAALKSYMHLSSSTAEDGILTMLANAVKAELEDMLGRVFLTEEIIATFLVEIPLISKIRGLVDTYGPFSPLGSVTLLRVPVTEISLVELETEPEIFTALDPALYGRKLSEPAIVTPYADAYDLLTFSLTQARLRVTYKAGYATADAIPEWMVLQFYQLFAERYATREGMTLPQTMGDAITSYRTPRV